MCFPKWKCLNFINNFTEVCFCGSNSILSINSSNGLMPNRCQAIIWIDDGLVYWSTYALLCPNELMDCTLTYIIIQRNVKRWLSTDIININITDLKTFEKICEILPLHFHSSKQLLIGKHLLLDMEWKAANLTHCGRVTHICVGELDQHWFR